jgi:hypothetical protein
LPLSKRARIEVYLPERRKPNYRRLKKAVEKEFLETFGGCTVIRDIKGLYMSSEGKADYDEIDLVYADTPFDFDKNLAAVSKYADDLRSAVLEATEEESILIVVHGIYHSV